MSLTTSERTAFASGYSRALVTSWSDLRFDKSLDDDPRSALAQVGIDVPETVELSIIRTTADPDGEGGVEAQVAAYEHGLSTGHVDVYIPDAPAIDTAELETSELHGVAAGGAWDPYCCSCCPSCCSASGGG